VIQTTYINTFVGTYSDYSNFVELIDSASSSFAGTIIIRITYGYEAQEHGDPILTLAEYTIARFCDFNKPGAYLVDFVPLCRPFSCSR
jgi:hypothetical protein